MYEWLIAGGGIHGCTIAAHLLKQNIIRPDQLKIIDPHPEPLAEWKERTAFIDMPYLRSPGVHHLDIKPFSLKQYGKRAGTETDFYGAYSRPSLYLFNEHCDHVIQESGLRESWHTGLISSAMREKDHWIIETEQGDRFHTKNLVVATGVNRRIFFPEWGYLAKRMAPSQVSHVFDDKKAAPVGPIAVIGGGISAAHLTIKLSKQYPGQVTQVTRHAYRVHDFDSDPGWLGPKYMDGFSRLSAQEKRRTIQQARHKGSIPAELNQKLHHLRKKGSYHLYIDKISHVEYKNNQFTLTAQSGKQLEVKTVYFATGFAPDVMSAGFLADLIKRENLQCAHCGFPLVNQHLEWCDHLFVSGPLAELELGPSSRNVIGAMKAADRITAASC
ncbi:SidA/IucD/PvdA family monooxygenase [Jeotgalibacillus sp. JSM ZJ347]|uniref:SidA/IucD/PvdA family monooxygenase n=1 Tax=Jeotgalibacillus sp. JSM ZJ347 TaxID=3342117 RepID=UPI0035A82C31